MLKKFMMKYMISCQEATRLLSERHDRSLTPAEYIAVLLRASMCSATRAYKKQCDALEKIYKSCDQYITLPQQKEGPKLPVDACDRMKKILRDKNLS